MVRRGHNLTSGIAALLALVVGTIGIPFLLVAIAGSPVPGSAPSMSGATNALTSQLTDGQILGALAVVCWIIWLAFTVSVIVEVVAWIRGSESLTLPLVGTLTRRLVVSAALLVATTQRPAAPLSQQLSVIAVEQPIHVELPSTSVELATSAQTSTTLSYVVAPRDDLWVLAENHLGDGQRWRELYDLNKGLPQPNGHTLQSPELLRPGWTLLFPADATGLATSSVPVAPGVPANGPTTVNEQMPDLNSPDTTEAVPVPAPSEAAPSSTTEVNTPAATRGHSLVDMGLLATGTVGLVDQLRRRRRRHRRLGTIASRPSGDMAAAEVLLRAADDDSQANRLNIAGRALAHCLSNSANQVEVRVEAVRVSPTEIEFLLDNETDAPTGPFEIGSDGRSWTLSSSVHKVRVGAFAVEMSAPLPALVHVGFLEGADVLVDLEATGVTAITGDHKDELGATLLTQLATSVWADHVEVVVIGIDAAQSLERVRRFDQLSEIPGLALSLAKGIKIALLEEGHQTTFQARATQDVNDGWVPTVLFVAESAASGETFDTLVEVAGHGGQGLSVVVIGDCKVAQRYISAGTTSTTIDLPAIELTPLAFDDETATAVSALIDHAANASDIAYEMTDMPIDLREIDDLPPAPPISINVLGGVEITGGKEKIKRGRSIEAIAYLALHRNGASDDKLKAALWPDKRPTPGTFNTTISLARRQLGEDSDGAPYLLAVSNGRYNVSQFVNSDLDRFEQLFAMAKVATDAQAIRLLSGALEMVRGRPFDDMPSGYAWAHVEGYIARAEAIVADAAHMLAELHLSEGDGKAAIWAARKGLLASPGYELLYRDLMLACEVDGNLGALETIMAELNTLLDAVDPSDNLEDETTDLYNRLRGHRSSAVSQ